MFVFCAQHDFWGCSKRATLCSRLTSIAGRECYFVFCSLFFCVKGNDPVSILNVSPPSSPLVLFPPLFSHLICSSFCWTPLCPSPVLPFSPILSNGSTHNPTSKYILYHPPFFPPPSFIIFPCATCQGLTLPWAPKFTTS